MIRNYSQKSLHVPFADMADLNQKFHSSCYPSETHKWLKKEKKIFINIIKKQNLVYVRFPFSHSFYLVIPNFISSTLKCLCFLCHFFLIYVQVNTIYCLQILLFVLTMKYLAINIMRTLKIFFYFKVKFLKILSVHVHNVIRIQLFSSSTSLINIPD